MLRFDLIWPWKRSLSKVTVTSYVLGIKIGWNWYENTESELRINNYCMKSVKNTFLQINFNNNLWHVTLLLALKQTLWGACGFATALGASMYWFGRGKFICFEHFPCGKSEHLHRTLLPSRKAATDRAALLRFQISNSLWHCLMKTKKPAANNAWVHKQENRTLEINLLSPWVETFPTKGENTIFLLGHHVLIELGEI